MCLPSSFSLQFASGGLCIKLLALGMLGLVGIKTIPAMTRYERPSWKRLYECDREIKHAEEYGQGILQKTEFTRQRIALRIEIVRDVLAGILSKEVAAQRFLEMNQSEPIILLMLRKTYSSSNDLECATNQLEDYIQGTQEDDLVLSGKNQSRPEPAP